MPASKKKSDPRVVPPSISKNRVFGSILIERLGAEKVPASLGAALKTFRSAHAALKSATSAVDTAHGTRSQAEAAIGGADTQLDAAINALANAFVGAGLGSRKNPFASFSRRAPGAVTKLAYARKVVAARAIVTQLKPKKLPAGVAAATKALGQRADAVANALGAVSKPAAAVTKAQQSLGGVAADWSSAYKRLKTLAAAAWIDQPETYKAIFAKAATVQAPKGKTRAEASKRAIPKKAAAAAKAAAKAQATAARAAAKAQATAAKAAAKVQAAASAAGGTVNAAAAPAPGGAGGAGNAAT